MDGSREGNSSAAKGGAQPAAGGAQNRRGLGGRPGAGWETLAAGGAETQV